MSKMKEIRVMMVNATTESTHTTRSSNGNNSKTWCQSLCVLYTITKHVSERMFFA
jgi:hypothetical protein